MTVSSGQDDESEEQQALDREAPRFRSVEEGIARGGIAKCLAKEKA